MTDRFKHGPAEASRPASHMAMRWNALRELALLRIRTFVREPEALFWTFGFPILMALGLGLAFRDTPSEPALIAVERGSLGVRFADALRADPRIQVRTMTKAEAADALRRGEVALVVAGTDTVVYRYDPIRPESRIARLEVDRVVQTSAGGDRPIMVAEEASPQPGARYIDWVVPGLLGLNLMSTGMWSIGFGIVNMRQKKQLKRLVATPMRRSDFLISQIIARLAFLVLEVPPIVLFALWIFDVEVQGSFVALALVVLLGTMAFSAMGLLAAARPKTIEGVSGVMNVVMLPMFILSGVFFSASRFPQEVQPFIRVLPLTALNDALRAIYNDGLSLTAVPGELLILSGWTVLCVVLALRWFRWQ